MTDRKKSTSAAMLKYHKKQLAQGTTREPRTKHKKPEKNTEAEVLLWANNYNIHLHVVDSSSYDYRHGHRGVQKAQTGFPDLVGNTEGGLVLWIELKAKDRRSTVSHSQRTFLLAKISQNCFAVVVDSAERLEQYWRGYTSLKNLKERQAYLYDSLPKKVVQRGKPRDKFEQEFGF